MNRTDMCRRHTGIEMPQFSRDENQYESLSDYFPTTGKGRRAARKSQRLSTQSEDMEMQESVLLESNLSA